MENVTDLAPDL